MTTMHRTSPRAVADRAVRMGLRLERIAYERRLRYHFLDFLRQGPGESWRTKASTGRLNRAFSRLQRANIIVVHQ